MRVILATLLLWPHAALAMNWEGHDDWMVEMEPAVTYQDSLPHAAPRPPAGCTGRAAAPASPANPYEQIPLSQRACAEAPPDPPAKR